MASERPEAIEIHLKTAEQLFNSLDPSSLEERDLDEKAERYIVSWAREIKGSAALQLIVTLREGGDGSEAARRIPEAVHNYFRYRVVQTQQELRELLRIGWRSLAIGLVVLLLCYVAIQYLSLAASQTAIQRLLEQSLVILGWVANWRPLEIFLYDWWPIRRKLVLLRRLAEAEVTVRAVPGS